MELDVGTLLYVFTEMICEPPCRAQYPLFSSPPRTYSGVFIILFPLPPPPPVPL